MGCKNKTAPHLILQERDINILKVQVMLKSKMGSGKFLVVVLVLSCLSLTNGRFFRSRIRLPKLEKFPTLMPFHIPHIPHRFELQTWRPPSLHDDFPAIRNIPLHNKTAFDEIFKKREDLLPMEYLYPTLSPPVQSLLEFIKPNRHHWNLIPSAKLTRSERMLLRRLLRYEEHTYLSKSDEAVLKRLYKWIRTTPSPSV